MNEFHFKLLFCCFFLSLFNGANILPINKLHRDRSPKTIIKALFYWLFPDDCRTDFIDLFGLCFAAETLKTKKCQRAAGTWSGQQEAAASFIPTSWNAAAMLQQVETYMMSYWLIDCVCLSHMYTENTARGYYNHSSATSRQTWIHFAFKSSQRRTKHEINFVCSLI